MDSEFVIAQDDTASSITSVLRDDDGDPVNLTGADVTFRMTPLGGGDPKVDDEDANNDDAGEETRGNVSYDWASGDTDTPGLYLAQWKVTFSGGAVQTFPNAGYILVRVTPIEFPATHDYVALEEFKKTRQLSGTVFAEEDAKLAITAASRGLDALTNRRFWADPAAVTRYYTPVSPRLVVIDDAYDIDTVKTGTGSNFPTTLTLHTDYEVSPLNAAADGKPWTMLESAGQFFPCFRRSVEVTGKFGWEAVPDPIKQAASLLASMLLLRHREAVFGVIVSGAEVGAVARIAKNDPHVMFLVEPYMRGVAP